MLLEIAGIKKSYDEKEVLSNLNIKLDKGIYGLLGENGAGKTTLFKIISGFIKEYDGTITYPKLNESNSIMLGYLPQSFVGYPEMTVYEFLEYLGNMKATLSKKLLKDEIDKKIELFSLSNLKNKRMKKLSGGQIRRVGLAQAFLLNPRVILLDEPTTGLDPKERIKVKNYISELGKAQTILLSTHLVSDLEYMLKKIFILKAGEIVMEGTEKELINKCNGLVWEVIAKNLESLHCIKREYNVSRIYESNGNTIVRIISKAKPDINAIEVYPNLEDVYLVNFNEKR